MYWKEQHKINCMNVEKPMKETTNKDSKNELESYLKSFIGTIPDFPKRGYNFKDVTTLLLNPIAFQRTIDAFYDRYRDMKITHVVSCEASGFIFGAPLALALKCSFVPVRRAQKLPGHTIGIDYRTGFLAGRLEVHTDAVTPGSRVIIIDDMIATGSTLLATYELMIKLGVQVVECACLLELTEAENRDKMKNIPVYSVINY